MPQKDKSSVFADLLPSVFVLPRVASLPLHVSFLPQQVSVHRQPLFADAVPLVVVQPSQPPGWNQRTSAISRLTQFFLRQVARQHLPGVPPNINNFHLVCDPPTPWHHWRFRSAGQSHRDSRSLISSTRSRLRSISHVRS